MVSTGVGSETQSDSDCNVFGYSGPPSGDQDCPMTGRDDTCTNWSTDLDPPLDPNPPGGPDNPIY